MKNLLLTGGTGLVGTDIRKQLIDEGYNLYVLTRRKIEESHSNLEWIQTDMRRAAKSFFKKLPTVDIVIHAGAAVNIPHGEGEFEVYRSVNMEFSENLFKWCTSLKKQTALIYISSLIFLQRPLLEIITESHPIAPLTLYGISKYWAEQALFRYSKNANYRPISFRLSSPVTFNFDLLHNTVLKKWINSALKNEKLIVFGKGSRTQDFVSTLDLAQAVIKAIQNNKATGIYNISSGSSISMTELARLITKRLGGKIEHAGEDVNENDRWNISIQKASRDFGFRPQYNSIEVINRLIDSIT